MQIIRQYSSQFFISILTQEVDKSVIMQHALKQAGYNVDVQIEDEKLHEELNRNVSHVCIIDLKSLKKELSQLLEEILNISSEIQFILLGEDEQIAKLEKYNKVNVVSLLNRNSQALASQILMTVDLICDSLIRLYQNEQIYSELKLQQNKVAAYEKQFEDEKTTHAVKAYQNRISFYRQVQSKEELLDVFYQNTPEQSWIYLKFASTIQTFVCVSYSNVPVKWTEGFSFKIPQNDSRFLESIFNGDLPQSLEKYLEDRMGIKQFKFLTFIFNEKIEGLLISPQDISAETYEDFSLMSLVYELKFAQAPLQTFEVEDPVTGLYTKDFYLKVIDREVDRAKRQLKPISLIKIAIDHYSELEQTQGHEVMKSLLKTVVDTIKLETRLTDFACRTEVNEFTLILTDCTRKGAALKAERLKQSFLNQDIKMGIYKVTFSQGISEYPTLSSNALDLDFSAKKALEFISEKGGDRICMSKAPHQHHPDFAVES